MQRSTGKANGGVSTSAWLAAGLLNAAFGKEPIGEGVLKKIADLRGRIKNERDGPTKAKITLLLERAEQCGSCVICAGFVKFAGEYLEAGKAGREGLGSRLQRYEKLLKVTAQH